MRCARMHGTHGRHGRHAATHGHTGTAPVGGTEPPANLQRTSSEPPVGIGARPLRLVSPAYLPRGPYLQPISSVSPAHLPRGPGGIGSMHMQRIARGSVCLGMGMGTGTGICGGLRDGDRGDHLVDERLGAHRQRRRALSPSARDALTPCRLDAGGVVAGVVRGGAHARGHGVGRGVAQIGCLLP